MTAPLLLGWVADQIELQYAFGLVMVLLLAITGLLLYVHHLKQKMLQSAA